MPSITAVVTAYNAEDYIGEALTAILSQTRPPDEVVVVDDGSTDATPGELARFGDEIRVVTQANVGHPGALNRGFAEARGDYVAKCDADDVWEPCKLERQVDTLRLHPEIDIACSAARRFGLEERFHLPDPGRGLLDGPQLARTLYRGNLICSTSTLIRRRLFELLGPFVERLSCEDYEYWLRALKAGAIFFHDPTVLVHLRQHQRQITADRLRVYRAKHLVHRWYADLLDDRRFVHRVLAADLFDIGRQLADDGRPGEARRAFRSALPDACAAFAPATGARALIWMTILSLPAVARDRTRQALAHVSRAIDELRGGRHPALP